MSLLDSHDNLGISVSNPQSKMPRPISFCCSMASLSPVCHCRRHLAAAEGKLSVAKWLLDQGCTPNPVDRFFRTPLEVWRCPSLPPAYPQLSGCTDRAGQAKAQPRPYMHPSSQTLSHHPLFSGCGSSSRCCCCWLPSETSRREGGGSSSCHEGPQACAPACLPNTRPGLLGWGLTRDLGNAAGCHEWKPRRGAAAAAREGREVLQEGRRLCGLHQQRWDRMVSQALPLRSCEHHGLARTSDAAGWSLHAI